VGLRLPAGCEEAAVSLYIYLAGAIGMWMALKDSGERFSWVWPVLVLTWPMWLVYSYVSETMDKPFPIPRSPDENRS
jgi:hypothetical protein